MAFKVCYDYTFPIRVLSEKQSTAEFFKNSSRSTKFQLKFMFSKKATKIDEIFTVDLTLCSKCQIDGEDFINICGLLRKHELYEQQATKFGVRTTFTIL